MRCGLIAIALTLCACTKTSPGPDNSSSDAGSGSSPAEQFLTKVFAAECAYEENCPALAPQASVFCAPGAVEFAAQIADLDKEIASGALAYDADHAQPCLDAIAAQVCSTNTPEPAACALAIHGTVQNGGACYESDECQTGWCDLSACPGACTAFVESGGDCSSNQTCDASAGLVCLDGSGGVCGTPGGSGAACEGDDECGANLFCAYGNGTGACAAVATGAAGTACAGDEGCMTGLYCLRSETNVAMCAAQVAAGQPCAEDAAHVDSIDSECAAGLVCAGYYVDGTSGAATAGTCAAISSVNGPCVAVPSTDYGITGCGDGLACVGSKCVAPPSSGPCTSDASAPCADGAYCDSANTCKPLQAAGVACTDDSSCASHTCTNGHCAAACAR